jgi:hypothetical protein
MTQVMNNERGREFIESYQFEIVNIYSADLCQVLSVVIPQLLLMDSGFFRKSVDPQEFCDWITNKSQFSKASEVKSCGHTCT